MFARALVMARHLYRLWRAGQVRFRLETFGLYYPAIPYEKPWFRMPPRNAFLLVRQIPSYARWVMEMEELRTKGPAGWWARHRPVDEDAGHDR